MPSNHLILCCPFSSCLQSIPASESFPMSQFFTSGGQSIGASASALVLPMNIQDWFPLGLTGWISLPSMGLSRVFSNTTVQKHQFLGVQLSLWPIKTWSSGLSNLKGEVGEYLNWIVSCAEVPITYGPHLRLASEVRAILWDWAHNQENPGWLWVVSIRTESNCGIPSCCQRIRGMVGVGKDTTYLMSKEKTA